MIAVLNGVDIIYYKSVIYTWKLKMNAKTNIGVYNSHTEIHQSFTEMKPMNLFLSHSRHLCSSLWPQPYSVQLVDCKA